MIAPTLGAFEGNDDPAPNNKIVNPAAFHGQDPKVELALYSPRYFTVL